MSSDATSDDGGGGAAGSAGGAGIAVAPAEQLALKLLLTTNASGLLIGKQGSTISQLQENTSSRVKLSQTGCYFPNTEFRVCLVTGTPDSVCMVVHFVLSLPLLENSIRLVLPSQSIGFIMGRSGSNLEELRKECNVTVRIVSARERLVRVRCSVTFCQLSCPPPPPPPQKSLLRELMHTR